MAKEQKPVTKTLRVSQIIAEDATQARVAVDEAIVAEYAELMRNGANFPPIDVVHDARAGKFYLVDGFHRLSAAQALGVSLIGATVTPGTLELARWLSCGANTKHGLRRTNADKRKAARAALMARPDLSDTVLAAHVGVSSGTVSNYRKELEAAGVLDTSTPRTGSDGRVIDVAKLRNNQRIGLIAAAAQRGNDQAKAKWTHCDKCRGSGMVRVTGNEPKRKV